MPAQNLSYAVASSRGWRVAMEDTYAAEVPLKGTRGVSLFAVYDGHGGAEVARYSALHMGGAIRDAPSARAAFGPSPATPSSPAAAGSYGVDPAATAAAAKPTSSAPAGPIDAQAAAASPASGACGDPAAAAAVRSPGACGGADGDPDDNGGESRRGTASANRDDNGGGGGGASPAVGGRPGTPQPHGAFTSAGRAAVPEAVGGGAAAATLREAFLSLDRQLTDEAHARELMALANPGALTAPPEAYGRRSAGGPFLGPAAGSTATVALVGRGGLTVASVGDSRCILGSRGAGMVVMSVDHKASDAGERERVVQAGCWVSASGRVCGELDMSRALGDADMKQAPGLPQHMQAVTADPTVRHVRLEPYYRPREQAQAQAGPGPEAQAGGGGGPGPSKPRGGGPDLHDPPGGAAGEQVPEVSEAGAGGGGAGGGGGSVVRATCGGGGGARGGGDNCYLLIASDGLWNVLSNDKVHEFVMERLEAHMSPEAICAQLCIEACVSERTAYDNVTVLLVLLHGVRPVGGDGNAGEGQGAACRPEVVAGAAAPAGVTTSRDGGDAATCTAGTGLEGGEAAGVQEPTVGQMVMEAEAGTPSTSGQSASTEGPYARASSSAPAGGAGAGAEAGPGPSRGLAASGWVSGGGGTQDAGSGPTSAWPEVSEQGKEAGLAVGSLPSHSAHWTAVALGDATCRVRIPGICSGAEEVQGKVCYRQRDAVILSFAQGGRGGDAKGVVGNGGGAGPLERFDAPGEAALAGLDERLLEASPMQEDAAGA